MKNLKINYQKLMALLISGALTLPLTGCFSKKEYVPMDNIFYDENTEGYDDAFEQRITDSETQIENMEKLENSIALVKKLQELDYSDVSREMSDDITLDDIINVSTEEIASRLQEYETLANDKDIRTNGGKKEQLNHMKQSLYYDMLMLMNYIEYTGKNTLYHFGNRLYDTILLETAGYEGNEHNIYAIVNQYEGSSSPPRNYAHYQNGTFTDGFEIDDNSKIYELILKVSEYQNAKELPNGFDARISISKEDEQELTEMINSFQEAIDMYKIAMMATTYEIKEGRELFDTYTYIDSEKASEAPILQKK